MAIPRTKQLLGEVEDVSEILPSAVSARFADSPKINLSRSQHKSLLAPEYSVSLQHAVEAYRTLRTRLVKCQNQTGIRSIVLSSASQGEGKTLTTFNLAVCFARMQNWPVLLVDADLRTQGLSRLVGDPHSAGLAQILETGSAYEPVVLQTDVPNLYILPAGESALPASELFARPAMKEFIAHSSQDFKLVLVDAPPILHLADFELIEAACEAVMLVVRLGVTDKDSLVKVCAHVDREKFLGLVLNDSRESPARTYYQYLSADGTK